MFIIHIPLLLFAVFPQTCRSFNSPFAQRCLISMWDITGCVGEGRSSPHNLTVASYQKLAAHNLLYVCQCCHYVHNLNLLYISGKYRGCIPTSVLRPPIRKSGLRLIATA